MLSLQVCKSDVMHAHPENIGWPPAMPEGNRGKHVLWSWPEVLPLAVGVMASLRDIPTELNQPALVQAMGGVFQHKREPGSMHMRLKLGACTVRAAFSHVPFIQSVIWIMRTVILQPSPGNLTADTSLTATQSAMEKVCLLTHERPRRLSNPMEHVVQVKEDCSHACRCPLSEGLRQKTVYSHDTPVSQPPAGITARWTYFCW